MDSGRTRRAGEAAFISGSDAKTDDWFWEAAVMTRPVRTGEAAAFEKTCDWPRRAAACTVWSAVGIRAGDRKTVDSFRVRWAADGGST